MSDAIRKNVINNKETYGIEQVVEPIPEVEEEKPLLFTDLPDDVIEMVMEYLSYDEIAQNRILCLRMNTICSRILNRAFTKTTVRHAALFKSIKSMLPRRESERRFVCLSIIISQST